MQIKILIADDEVPICKALAAELAQFGYDIHIAHSGLQALELLRSVSFDIAMLDIKMPYVSGLQILKEIKTDRPHIAVIIMTAYASIDGAVSAMKLRADDYLVKPFDIKESVEKINTLIKFRSKIPTAAVTREKPDNIMLARSSEMSNIQKQIEKIKNVDTTVLVTGESGTGKGVVAKQIHMLSTRKTQPFIHVDCAALPHSLIESELFGHEKGAFTNAINMQKGKFETAGNGTIFLDEIATLPITMQTKLLNVLQEKYFYRIGGSVKIPMLARIIAATNENLEQCIQEKTFRTDLFYRLNVVKIECPPLRYRKQDILELAKFFIDKHSAKFNIRIDGVQDEVYEAILSYDWPGNVRELENVLESVIVLSESSIITRDDLPAKLKNKQYECKNSNSTLSLKEQELLAIIAALEKHDGHREKTAKELGISKRTLQYKLRNLDIK